MKFIKDRTKRAFTLAEVLITLGIIGVVAAITMPTLIQKHQEQRTVAQLTKAYSTLSQAWQRMETEYGTIDTWGMTNTDTGLTDEDGNRIIDPTSQNLVKNRLSEFIKISTNKANGLEGKTVYDLDGGQYFITGDEPYFITSDGTYVGFGYYGSGKVSIYVILPTKQDNILGKNVFYFAGYPNKVIPEGTDIYKPFDQYCRSGISKNAGRGCTAWVLYNKNMDYLHCRDELSWNGKTKCN